MTKVSVLNNQNYTIFYKNEVNLFSIPRGVTVESLIITNTSLIITTSQLEVVEINDLELELKFKLMGLIIENCKVIKIYVEDGGSTLVNNWTKVLDELVPMGVYIDKLGKVVKLKNYEELISKLNEHSNPIYVNYMEKNKVTTLELMNEIKSLQQLLINKGII